MRLSEELLDAVEASLPGPGAPGLKTKDVHDRTKRWRRTTIRHALAALARAGRAEFTGHDRHRHYRRVVGSAPKAEDGSNTALPSGALNGKAPSVWRPDGARPDSGARRPGARAAAELME
jgi:hypothetical protein